MDSSHVPDGAADAHKRGTVRPGNIHPGYGDKNVKCTNVSSLASKEEASAESCG